MIVDKLTRFSDQQSVTTGSDAGVASDDKVDLKAAIRDLGVGERLYVVSVITLAMTDTGSNSALDVILRSDNDSAFGSPTTIGTLYTFPAVSPAGTMKSAALPSGIAERYLDLLYDSTNGDLSQCKITSFLTPNPQLWTAYAKGYEIDS